MALCTQLDWAMVEQPDANYRNNLISKPSTPPCKTESRIGEFKHSRTAAQSQAGTLQTRNSFQSIPSQLQHQVLPTWRTDSDFLPGNPQIHSQPIKSLQSSPHPPASLGFFCEQPLQSARGKCTQKSD